MKTLFINGLMLERSQVFLRHLARNFHVIGDGLKPLQAEPGMNITDPFSIAGVLTQDEAKALGERINDETQILADQLVTDIKALNAGPSENWALPQTYIDQTLRPKVSRLLKMETHLKMVHAISPIDMVISGADYGSHARVIARTARQMGIPTLNLEHGFFFNQIRWEFCVVTRHMPMFFASEYVNLDSPLEVELFEELLANFPDQGTKFLGLGTPVDTVVGQSITQEVARQKLGLPANCKVVTLVCRWIEAHSISSLVKGQANTIDVFENLFRTLAEDEFHHDLQLLIKLHPAEARPDVMPGVQSCLENMARRFGLPAPLVYGDQLPEVISAADVITSIGFSSVLFDAFQLGKASVVLTPPFLVPSSNPEWRTRGNTPLAANVMEIADDAADLWRRVADWMKPDRQTKLAVDVSALKQKYNLQHRSVEEKSASIVQWIKDFPAK